MWARFHAEPIVQATELLLQECTPRGVRAVYPWVVVESAAEFLDVELPVDDDLPQRTARRPLSVSPERPLFGDGRRLQARVTAAGDLAVRRPRGRPPATTGAPMSFSRDVDSGNVWSAGFQPSGTEPDDYDVAFNEDRAEFACCDGTLKTTMEVLVSAEDDAEVRRVSISILAVAHREIDVTSYAELAPAPQAADVTHPAFSKLFVETQYRADVGAILATRIIGEPQ